MFCDLPRIFHVLRLNVTHRELMSIIMRTNKEHQTWRKIPYTDGCTIKRYNTIRFKRFLLSMNFFVINF